MHELRESGEDYLETILLLSKLESADPDCAPIQPAQPVRSVDVAAALGFTKASVSRAIHLLEDKSLLIMAPDGALLLTPDGLRQALNVYKKHRVLTDFLIDIGVDSKTAEQDACRIEHVVSNETINAIYTLYQKMGGKIL